MPSEPPAVVANATVERTIAAPVSRVFEAVVDITRMSTWSPECTGAHWLGQQSAPVSVGARFRGSNRRGLLRWSTTCTVLDVSPGRLFAFRVSVLGRPTATWTYTFEAASGGTRVRESWEDHRGRLSRAVNDVGLPNRAGHAEAQMRATLDNLAAGVEVRDG